MVVGVRQQLKILPPDNFHLDLLGAKVAFAALWSIAAALRLAARFWPRIGLATGFADLVWGREPL
jgi:hypothetical protein